MKSVIIMIGVMAVACSGCGSAKAGDEPTKYRSQDGLARLSSQAAAQSPLLPDISDNPAFFNTADKAPRAPAAKDLDAVIRPVLKKVFKDARLVAESTAPETKADGEVVENKLTYVVRQLMVPEEGRMLHAAFMAAGFGLSPRLGAKPSAGRTFSVMSLFKRTGSRSYSLVIKIDANTQRIVIESYRLGSKYDRLM